MLNSTGKIALVTGASRGIGAAVSHRLAERGVDIVVNYRSKAPRAEAVAETIQRLGRRAVLAQADITQESDVNGMIQIVKDQFSHLDYLILNASGGLEKDKPADYAMMLNLTAQEQLVDRTIPLMQPGGRIVFVTSHLAHFYGQKPVHGLYEPVAASKQAGEQALRRRIPELTDKGISLIVVSGDLIEGTITPKLMERSSPGLIEARREQAGVLPTVEEFARAIAEACVDPARSSGETVFVGSTDWE
ncbi:MAG: SDR family oxidoreductase [Oculatellaceae cyanobacterium Prado106]|nr:SDR family oxidoreductase [Oculatellaceae cyanobacterium Prado106]